MAEVAVRRCCDKFTDEKAAPAVFYAKLDDNSPTEFACCGEKACDDKQYAAASSGRCSLGCGKRINPRWVLRMKVKADDCSRAECGVECTTHAVKDVNWMMCSHECYGCCGC